MDREERSDGTEIVEVPTKEDLTRALECPLCLEIPYGSIFLCESGHSVCRKCIQSSVPCPICQKNYTKIRNLCLECLISTLRLECTYKNEGCTEICQGGEPMEKHVDACEFRPILCNDKNLLRCCNQLVPYSNYLDHIKKFHGSYILTPVGSKVSLPQTILTSFQAFPSSFPVSVVQIEELSFLIKCVVTGSVVYWFVCVFGNELTASQFHASLSIYGIADGKRADTKKILWTNKRVLSIRENVTANSPETARIALRDLFNLSWPTVENMVDVPRYSWRLEVDITKIAKENGSNQSPPPCVTPSSELEVLSLSPASD